MALQRCTPPPPTSVDGVAIAPPAFTDDEWKGKKLSKAAIAKLPPLDRFKYTHRNVRGRWEVAGGFPSRAVMEVRQGRHVVYACPRAPHVASSAHHPRPCPVEAWQAYRKPTVHRLEQPFQWHKIRTRELVQYLTAKLLWTPVSRRGRVLACSMRMR